MGSLVWGNMDSKEINVTYETLFELLRRERNREEIQELSDNFFSDVVEYINSKKQIMTDSSMADQKQKIETQLKNIQKILKELYEKRERKIISMAINKSRTGSDIFDTDRLLSQELTFYNEILKVCNNSRKEILDNILSNKVPEQKTAPVQRKDNTTVRFKHPIPKFIGKELETYGPFDTDDIASLPSPIADVLIKKNRAEEISD